MSRCCQSDYNWKATIIETSKRQRNFIERSFIVMFMKIESEPQQKPEKLSKRMNARRCFFICAIAIGMWSEFRLKTSIIWAFCSVRIALIIFPVTDSSGLVIAWRNSFFFCSFVRIDWTVSPKKQESVGQSRYKDSSWLVLLLHSHLFLAVVMCRHFDSSNNKSFPTKNGYRKLGDPFHLT